MIKSSTLKNIRRCPRCGKVPELQRNTSKEFRVRCQCGISTHWTTKPQAIITWYNILIQLAKNEGNPIC